MPKDALTVIIGDALVGDRIITPEQLHLALAKQEKQPHKKLGEILVELGFVEEKIFLEYLARELNLTVADISHANIDLEVARILPEHYARRFEVLLLAKHADSAEIAIVNPLDIFAVDEIARFLQLPVKLRLAGRKELLSALDLVYRRTAEISNFAGKLDCALRDFAPNDSSDLLKKADTAVVQLLNSLFEDAVQVGASDIHIEPDENVVRLRLRVDGVLQEQILGEKHVAAALSQLLKMMAGLKITEKRLPQDGRFEIKVRDIPIDVRISVMPVHHGESVVLRLLNKNNKILVLDNLGLASETLKRLRHLIHLPQGMLLVTGPTGSGKTTTLYSALSEINEIGRNIITIEDPVEYRLPRVNQIQVNPELGLTFARVLVAALRQDPNVVLVGEIRDEETATIALRAALTGHLVLSTLHTNDAASSAIRLLDMGVESYLVAATVKAVLAQRLVRRVCESCGEEYQPEENIKALFDPLFAPLLATGNFRRGKGCTYCNKTGYKGRIGVFELLEFDESMLDALRENKQIAFAEAARRGQGATTLLASALQFACQGVTTLDEVLRMVGE